MVTKDRRVEHPFYMYDAILAQPEALVRVYEKNVAAADRFAAGISSCRRMFIVGIGTSYHAARLGEYLVGKYGAGMPVQAINSLDFALYGPELGPDDCVIAVSHRGAKRYTALALRRASGSGCSTALVTGEGGSSPEPAGSIFRTVEQEKSSAHTVSYVGSVAVLAALAEHLGRYRGQRDTAAGDLLRRALPEAMRAALDTESRIRLLAREHAGRRRIWLAGGGPSAVTAQEIALKIKETSYLQAEGMCTETLLHGPFQCVEAEDLFVLVTPSGAARERTLEVAELAREIGAACLVTGDRAAGVPRGVEEFVAVPEVREPFSSLVCLVPLQLLAYHLALARGTNPDSFRAEDPRFARINVSARL